MTGFLQKLRFVSDCESVFSAILSQALISSSARGSRQDMVADIASPRPLCNHVRRGVFLQKNCYFYFSLCRIKNVWSYFRTGSRLPPACAAIQCHPKCHFLSLRAGGFLSIAILKLHCILLPSSVTSMVRLRIASPLLWLWSRLPLLREATP